MSKKYTYDEVRKIVEDLGYELVSEEYLSNKQNLILKDEFRYYYTIRLNNIISGSKPDRFNKHNPYTIQNIKLWCKLENKPFELISDVYESATKSLQWKCLKDNCGEVFESKWGYIKSGYGCGYCYGNRVGILNCLATKNPEIVSEWHPTLNGDLTPYNVTAYSSKKVWWKCENGHEWKSLIAGRSRDGYGCPYCAGILPTKENNLLKINPKLCEEWDYEKNDKLPSDYTPFSSKKVWWKCKKCNHSWNAVIGSRAQGNGCPACMESKGEVKIHEFLKENKIEFIAQMGFDGLLGMGGRNLTYDFYIPSCNLLIEYQGEQHFKFKKAFHIDMAGFRKQQEHDRRKFQYAYNNNINFLEIWYWDFDNIEDLLIRELSLPRYWNAI